MIHEVERFPDIEWQQVSEHARQKLIDNGEKRVRLLKLSPGFQELEWCQRGHTGYVIDGSLEMEFNEGHKKQFTTGDAILVSQGEAHKARTGGGSCLLFLVDEI